MISFSAPDLVKGERHNSHKDLAEVLKLVALKAMVVEEITKVDMETD